MAKKILLVEDDIGLMLTLTDMLTREGYQVESACDGLVGFKKAMEQDADMVILDVSLPCKNGLDVCRELRQSGIHTPILMLTGRGRVPDKVTGLKCGADDYMAKPFDPTELMARVEAQMRRGLRGMNGQMLPESYHFGKVMVDFGSARVFNNGQPVKLSARLFQLLRYFIEKRGKLISRDELLRNVWGYEETPITRTVDVHVVRLRQKLEQNPTQPEYFTTVYGAGYKFVA